MPPSIPSRTQDISNVLRDEILRGQYRPGERLPSERDLVSRFETSRGTVREAFKKLEQLGVVSIQPGGARVVPVEDCTLDILGPLLDLGEVPDPLLIDHALEVGGVLVSFAVVKAMENGADATVIPGTGDRAGDARRRRGEYSGRYGTTPTDQAVRRIVWSPRTTADHERPAQSGCRTTTGGWLSAAS